MSEGWQRWFLCSGTIFHAIFSKHFFLELDDPPIGMGIEKANSCAYVYISLFVNNFQEHYPHPNPYGVEVANIA